MTRCFFRGKQDALFVVKPPAFKAVEAVTLSGQQPKGVVTPLHTNSAFLIANSALAGILGLVFWVVAARFYDAEAVGLGSAAISMALLLSHLAGLGLDFGLVRFLSRSGDKATSLINSCFTLSSLAAMILAIIFLIGLPLWSPALAFLRESPLLAVAFVAFTAAGVSFRMLTQTFVALRRAEFVLILGSALGPLRLLFVILMIALSTAFSIFAAWGLTVAVLGALGVFVFLPRLLRNYEPLPSLRLPEFEGLRRFCLTNYVTQGLWRAPTLLLPVLISNALGGEANAYFYVSWAVASQMFDIPVNISLSLFSEGSYQESVVARDFLKSLKFAAMLLIPCVLLMLTAGEKFLSLFGRDYAAEGTRLVWLLALAAFPLSINMLYLAVARVRKELGVILLLGIIAAVGTLTISFVLLPTLGILGPGVAWLVSQCMITVAIVPRIIRVLKGL